MNSRTLLVFIFAALAVAVAVPQKSKFSLSFIIHVAKEIDHSISGNVYPRGTYHYAMRRIVHNGLCRYRFPDMVAVPRSTDDVSRIMQAARAYGFEVSVRSGGHSFLCNNIKDGGIHIDMRAMNKVELAGKISEHTHAARLGPGSSWERVLKLIPPKKFTMIHGQCESVGVGGYLLGGGINVVGTTERLGAGSQNVIQFTMVTAEGDVAEVTKDNVTIWRHQSGYKEVMPNDYGGVTLHAALGNAGSSFGIVTEFLYKIWPKPETTPAIAIVYFESPYDLRKLENAAQDGRYHVIFFLPYLFHRSYSLDTISYVVGIAMLPPFLRFLQRRKVDPIFVACTDNRGIPHTSKSDAYAFLESYGLRLAKSDGPVSAFIPNMFSLHDYERVYLSKEEQRERGYQGVASANIMGLSSLRLLDNFMFNHPVFGFKRKYSTTSMYAGCDFCYFIVVSTSNPQRTILELVDTGTYQVELTCTYQPYAHKKCPAVLKQVKEEFRQLAVSLGDVPTQYVNTPSCDASQDFGPRYYGDNYEKLVQLKRYWDPDNVFNHCQSIGNTDVNCCPQRV